MIKMTSCQLRTEFAAALNQISKGKRILIRRKGKDVAALVSVEDLKAIEKLLSLRSEAVAVLKEWRPKSAAK